MITSLKSRLLTAAVVLSSLSVTLAQSVPSGSYTFAFDPSVTPIYDLTGDYVFDQTLVGAGSTNTPLSFEIPTVVQDRSGNLKIFSGFYGDNFDVVNVSVGQSTISAWTRLSGKISRHGSVTTAVFTVHLWGNDYVAGIQTPFSINLSYNLDVIPSGLRGTVKGTASFSRVGTGRIPTQNVDLTLPPDMTGAWTNNLSILATKRLGGSGTIVLSNGKTLSTKLSGTYNSKNNLSKLTQTGNTSDSSGSSLNLTLIPDANSDQGFDVLTLKGKVLGQSISQ